MHILHIEKMLLLASGVTSYVRALTKVQRQRGHAVSMFGCGGPDNDRLPPFRDFARERSPLALWRMIESVRAANLLERFLRGLGRVDVAHVHNIYHHLTPSILPVLARRRIPIVMTVHDYRLACPTKHFLRPDGVCMRCLPHRLYHAASPRCAGLAGAALAAETLVQRFLRRYVRWVDLFLCPSAFMAEVLARVSVPSSKLAVTANTIDRLDLPAGVARAARRLLYAGRVAPEKGTDLMLDLADRVADTEVVIAGGGGMLAELKEAARRRKVGNVTFTGPLDRGELAREFAAAAVVVIPSRCIENSPQTMLEAMACGRAVVAADHAPLRQWVTDRETGRLFAPGSAASLAAVVGEVLADPAGREAMERRAAEVVARRHDTAAVAERIERLYLEARRRCALRW